MLHSLCALPQKTRFICYFFITHTEMKKFIGKMYIAFAVHMQLTP